MGSVSRTHLLWIANVAHSAKLNNKGHPQKEGFMIVIFDVVGTLFNLDRIQKVFGRFNASDELPELWFARLLHSSMTATLTGRYLPFYELAEAGLRQIIDLKDLPEDLLMPALKGLQELDLWDDARECLDTLQADDHQLVALTNSGSAAVESLFRRAEISNMFELILSADDVGACKPNPAPYRMALNRMNVYPPDACMISAHGWDILGAHTVGLRTVWVSRLEKQWPFPGDPPDLTVATLSEIPSLIPRPREEVVPLQLH